MSTMPCPSDLALEQYLLGELAPSQSRVGDHVEACGACRTKVADKAADNVAFAISPGAEAVSTRPFCAGNAGGAHTAGSASGSGGRADTSRGHRRLRARSPFERATPVAVESWRRSVLRRPFRSSSF